MEESPILSKWWRTKSAKAAFRRVEKQKREKLKKLRAYMKTKQAGFLK
jgi:hypothetical protein